MKTTQTWLRYGFEGLLLYMLFILFYIHLDQLPPIIPYIVIYILSALVFFVWFRNHGVSHGLFFAAVPVFAALGWFLGLSPFLAIGLAVICCWRIAVHFFQFKDSLEEINEFALFLSVFVLALFLYIFVPSYAYHNGILVIVILQLLWLFGMKIHQRYVDSGAISSGTMFLRWGSGALGGLMVIAAFFLLLYPVVKWIFFTGFSLFAKVVGTAIGYPAFWLISRLYGDPDKKQKPREIFNRSEEHHHKMDHLIDSQSNSFPVEWIFWGLMICAFIFVFIKFYRKKRAIQIRASSREPKPESYQVAMKASDRKRNKDQPPGNKVRRRFYQLQKALAKKGYGRMTSESVSDWFARLDFSTAEKAIVTGTYRKVRYGEQSLSDEERGKYEQAIKILIQEAKNRKKDNRSKDK